MFLRYVSSRIETNLNDDIYRFYVTGALKILTSNTAKFAGGTELVKNYSEIISGSDTEEEEENSSEKEAQNIIARMKSKIANMGR